MYRTYDPPRQTTTGAIAALALSGGTFSGPVTFSGIVTTAGAGPNITSTPLTYFTASNPGANGVINVNGVAGDPPARTNFVVVNNEVILTADNGQETQSIIAELFVNPNTHTLSSAHNAGLWGVAAGLGDNSGGVMASLIGVGGIAANVGLGTVTQASAFLSRAPSANIANGHVTNHYGFFEETYPNDGTCATNCYGASFAYPVGVGTATPTYAFDDASGKGVRTTGPLNIATSTPASAAAAGVTGTIAWDASFIYVCIATNTWKRAAIATW